MAWRQLGVFLALTAALGCVDNAESLVVLHAEVPNDSCEVAASEEGVFRSVGTLDLSLTDSYMLFVTLVNRLNVTMNREANQLESNDIQIRNVRIWYSSQSGISPSSKVIVEGSETEWPTSGVVAAESGLMTLGINVIPPGIGVAFAQMDELQVRGAEVTIQVHLVVEGETLSGTYIESGEFIFPVSLCQACLIYFPADFWDPGQQKYTCEPSVDDEAPLEACFPGQDDPVDCRTCLHVKACQTSG